MDAGDSSDHTLSTYHQTGPASCALTEAVVTDGVWHRGAPGACCAGLRALMQMQQTLQMLRGVQGTCWHSSAQAIESTEDTDEFWTRE